MKAKKYEEVNYIAVKERRPLWIAVVLILIFFITLETIIALKGIFEVMRLYKENEELKKIIIMQKSMIADIQEDNMKLQEMIDSGNH